MNPFMKRAAAPALVACAAMAAPAMPATAQETGGASYPYISGELAVTIQNDFTFSSDDPAAELNDLYTDSELLTEIHFAPQLKLVSLFHLEPVKDPVDDRFFEDQGVYVEELFLHYDFDAFAISAGKYAPTFGLAWDAAPGIYGTDFAEDYEIAERIGAGVEVPFTAGGGEHVLAANVFFADTTFLSESAFTGRGQLDKSDGGVSNTESPESFSLTIDGEIPSTPLGYHLGSQFQSA